ncbi:hypothetical protein Q604_UNBc4C00031G0026 [human gut metagenome]|uniref:Branched-chain amino acid transport system carrier protein n=2 Tax=root TaxID=1 RepID=A0A6N2YEJ2_9FIRM
MKEKVSILNVVKFGGAYAAFVIGSGFATGQEILQFFTCHGIFSIGSILISLAIFAIFASVVMGTGYVNRDNKDFKPYQYFCGKYLGKAYDVVTPICLFLMFVVMISGAGATLNEYYGLNVHIGSIIMVALVLIAFLCGLEKLVDIVGLIGPVILVFAIVVGIITLTKSVGNISEMSKQISSLNIIKSSNNWIISGILYGSYNIALGAVFVASIAKDANSKKEAMLGGAFGGIALMLSALVMNLALLSKATEIYELAIPTLYFAKSISNVLGVVFSIILFCGIFSTAAPGFWTIMDSVSNNILKGNKLKTNICAVATGVLSLAGGVLPFQELISIVYPYTGYLGIVLFVCVVFKLIKSKKNKDDKQKLNKVV